MASATFEIEMRATGGREFDEVARKLRDVGPNKELQRKLRAAVYEQGRPVVFEIQAAVREVDVQSTQGGIAPPSYSRGLRQKAAAGVRMYVAYKGVRFTVHSTYVGAGKYSGALLKYLDSELPMYKNWRHPVFGNKEVWTVQHGQPWFFVTVRRHADAFERACLQAMEEVLEDVAR